MSTLPTCQVCNQQFSRSGPAPFLLPCLHSVCETCVTSADGGVIHCRPCERDVNLTETPLQKDEVREKQILHLTVQHHPELVLCTYDGNQAVCWCNECDGFLCAFCQMVHSSSKATKKHVVQDVGEMDPGKLDEDQYCSVHPKYIADTLDKDCCMLTCIKCRRGEHADHECVDVEEMDMIAKSEIVKLGKEVQVSADQHAVHLEGAEKDLQSTDETRKRLANEINFHSNALKVVIDQRQGELKIDLKNYMETVRTKLAEIKTTSETCHQRCQTTSDYINNTLRYSSRHNIRELKPLFEKKYKDCKSSAPSEDYTSIPLPVFNTGRLKKAALTVALFGTIEMADIPTENQIKDTGTQTEDDVVQELENLTQEVNKLKMDQDQLIKENKKMEKESEEAAEKFKQEVNLLKLSQDRQLKETEKTKGDSWKEAEKLRQEVNLLKLSQDRQLKETEKTKGDSWKEAEKLRQEVNKFKMDQDQLIKENKKMEKESEEAAEKFKQEVNLLKLSQDRQLKETEKTKGDSWKEAEKLRQEVNKFKMDQDQLIKENKKMEKESEEAAEKFKQEVNLLKLSQDRQLKETEKTKGDSWKEAEKLRQEVNKLKMDQDQLIKENKKMEKESEEAAEKFKQEVNLLKLSQDRQLKETEKTKGDSWKEAEKLRQEVNKFKMDQDQLIKENKKMEKESEEAAEKFKQEVNLLKLSQDRQLKETEKTKGDSWKEAEKLRQEVNKLKMDQDQLIKENKKMEKESKEAAEKLKQETKKLNVYQEKITGLEEIERRWHKLRTKALYEPFLLKCTKLKFSVTQYNTKTVHINTDSKLINRPQPNPPHSDQRLKKYDGTSSIVPLPQCGPPQYFEVESQVGIEKTLTRNTLLLEIGLAREEEQDQSHSINARSNSYSLTVLYCTTHSSICRKVWRHGTSLTCLSDTLENTPGTSATLHYGVVYDSARSRIVFLDVTNEKIIGKIDNVDSSVALWPMFGVYNRRMVRVSMSLVVGDDINLTDKKKALILDCLS